MSGAELFEADAAQKLHELKGRLSEAERVVWQPASGLVPQAADPLRDDFGFLRAGLSW